LFVDMECWILATVRGMPLHAAKPVTMNEPDYDVVVVGHGAAGLAAALAAAEAGATRVLVVERAPQDARGGNTRWSPSYMRLETPDRLAPRFIEDMLETSGGRSDPAYVRRLAAEASPVLTWLQQHGLTFDRPLNYFLTAAAPRIQPVGAGAAIVERLTRAASAAGVSFAYATDAQSIDLDAGGSVAALRVRAAGGSEQRLATRAIVLACGGFESDPVAMREHLGEGAESIRPITAGTAYNAGAGIRMAIAAGARTAGDWNGVHVEPVDPRSERPEPVVLTYPYGIVVDRDGRRFFDEGGGRVDETWETLARTIHFSTPGRIAYAVFDAALGDIPDYGRAVCTDQEPIRASTIRELGAALEIDAAGLAQTVTDYNAAAPGDARAFEATRVDGLATTGLNPPKSNWARRIERAPFLAYPLVCAICYTFGGIETDAEARVIGNAGPIPGLFAAGEITGQFYGKAPGGTSVLRALVFGRIAGQRALSFGRIAG
jgi:tricarballylate dehydrogenase